jgi:hypothetical protein
MAIVSISADLSAPPSEKIIFRDVCLFCKIFKKLDVVAITEKETIDYYVIWFRKNYLFDFVDDIISKDEELNTIIDIESGTLTYLNYSELITKLNRLII